METLLSEPFLNPPKQEKASLPLSEPSPGVSNTCLTCRIPAWPRRNRKDQMAEAVTAARFSSRSQIFHHTSVRVKKLLRVEEKNKTEPAASQKCN